MRNGVKGTNRPQLENERRERALEDALEETPVIAPELLQMKPWTRSCFFHTKWKNTDHDADDENLHQS